MAKKKQKYTVKYNGLEWIQTPQEWWGPLEDKIVTWWDKKTQSWIEVWERWAPLKFEGGENIWYSVSTTGRIISHLPNGRITKYDRNYNYERASQATIRKSKDDVEKIECRRLDISFPSDYFEKNNSSYTMKAISPTTVRRTCTVHELVAYTHYDIDLNPPERLKDEWDAVITPDMVGQPLIPPKSKQVIRESMFIDHLDHDAENNFVENFERVTPRENTDRARKFYGGSFRSPDKKKQIQEEEEEFIIITPPKRVRTVFEDTWIDGNIEFVGDKGEELYGLIEKISERDGVTPGEAFWNCMSNAYDEMMEERKSEHESA